MNISHPLRSAMWLLLEKILALGLSFFVTIAVARHLLPSLFGQLSFWLALVSMALPISALGLNTLITREILLRPHDRDVIVGSALGLRALAGLCVATSGSLVCYWYLPADEAVCECDANCRFLASSTTR